MGRRPGPVSRTLPVSASSRQGKAQHHGEAAVRTVFRAYAAANRLQVATHDPQADAHVGAALAVALAGLGLGTQRDVALEDARQLHVGHTGSPVEHRRSEEHTSELQTPMRTSYAVFCLKKKKRQS